MDVLKLARLSDGELLCLAIQVEEECALRFQEMAWAVHFSHGPNARCFHRMASEEEEHRDRLVGPWRVEGAPPLSEPTVRLWLAVRCPEVATPWPREDDDVERALRRARTIERVCIRFYEVASRLALDPDVKSLFTRMAAEEADHAHWLS